ncbi:MAG: type I restriction enzyme HsdR N-terminal domain-containing protein [Desulfobacteraceae bacterium]|nr:type I restriction enzyme HsdR N-terminal domain-containing protein [Desulfobacteraceae bacterium]MBC2756620.1 type I restriction enzyme HsdR N-terminal domain-containing protein [Desulfobacteraceae bacterium]
MPDIEKAYDMLVDYITGKTVPNVGVEEIRQRLEQYLVEIKGYQKKDIRVDADIEIDIKGSRYASQLDLVVSVENRSVMVIKCAAGSLESREREVVSASRIFESKPIPYAVVSDSKTAVVFDTVSGKKIDHGLHAIPSRAAAEEILSTIEPALISEKRKEKEKIIFRSYDSMNVNVQRNF